MSSTHQTSDLLDCGHPESPHSDITRGYGSDAEGRKYCYACCQRRDREYMDREGKITVYLSSDRKLITGWPGYELARVTTCWETSAGGFARNTMITRFRAVDSNGGQWYGTSPGRGMYARLRRAKRKAGV